ncbi:hypothetical protein JCM10295v2_005704 [Rhodotorula toruloides]
MVAMSALFEKIHQLSPHNRERVKDAFDDAALLLEFQAPYNEAALILRGNHIIETPRGAIPLFLNQPALDAMMQLMTYLANQHASCSSLVPSPGDLVGPSNPRGREQAQPSLAALGTRQLMAAQAFHLATLGGEYLQIVQLSWSNTVVCTHLTFENFLNFSLFFGRAVKEVFEGWVAHGIPRFSIGSLMIHAIRTAIHHRLDTFLVAYPRGRVPQDVKALFEARRQSIDSWLNRHSTLTPNEMATFLGECNALDKVK